MSARWIDQTRTRDTHPAVRGDCTRAAIASLFALPLDAVPDFDADDPVAFYEGVEAFFLSLGYEMVRLDGDVALDALHLANGPAARGVSHSVVRRGTEIVHDPHPSRAGLLSVEFVVVPVPLDPSRLLPAQAYRERLQAIVDWADLAHSASHEFADHGLGLLRGPVFDEARAALSTLPSAAGGDPTPVVGGAALPGVEEIAEALWETSSIRPVVKWADVASLYPASSVHAQFRTRAIALRARLADRQARPAAPEGVDGRLRAAVEAADADMRAAVRIIDDEIERVSMHSQSFKALHRVREAVLASSAPAGSVDALVAGDMVLMPREPTEAMLDAMHSNSNEVKRGQTVLQEYRERYDRLLAAALASSAPTRGVEPLSTPCPTAPVDAVREAGRVLLKALDDLIGESEGVYGLHRNGDPAPWSELIEGGTFEDWLSSIETFRAALDAGDGGAAAGDGWRDIATAPRDMTVVLGMAHGVRGFDFHETWWFAPSSSTQSWMLRGGRTWKPTRWRPLPAPPTTSTTTGTEGRDHG